MKQQIYFYKLFLLGEAPEEYIYLTQEQGQKLSVILDTDPSRKFIMVNDDMPSLNTNSIKKISRHPVMLFNAKTQKEDIPDVRELTSAEQQSQKLLEDFKGAKLLT